EVAVRVKAGSVACEIGHTAVLRPVGLDVAFRLLVQGAEHARPRPLQDEIAAALLHLVSVSVIAAGLDARERHRRGAGLGPCDAWEWSDHDVAGLGLPPAVHHRTALLADHLAIPEPRLWVDRLAHAPEQTKRAEVVPLGVLAPPLDASPDRCRCGIEDRAAVALDDLPPPVLVRIVGGAFVENRGAPIRKRAVDDVGVTGHPAD